MQMNKQRKMLIGVLCLGLGGLAVDRLLLSAPDSAVAEQEDVVDLATPPIDANLADAALQGQDPRSAIDADALPSYASLTERLVLAQQQQTEAPVSGRDDPFAVPKQWQAQQPETLVKAQEGSPKQHRIASFFKLDGTVRSLNNGKEELLAVISGGGLDGVAIRVKQRIRVPNSDGPPEEYELVEVGSRYVVWYAIGTDERIRMNVEQDF